MVARRLSTILSIRTQLFRLFPIYNMLYSRAPGRKEVLALAHFSMSTSARSTASVLALLTFEDLSFQPLTQSALSSC